jgi:hypothetical protein
MGVRDDVATIVEHDARAETDPAMELHDLRWPALTRSAG